MNTQISFLDGTYTLIHIPLDLYTSLLQPIIRVLLPRGPADRVSSDAQDGDFEVLSSETQHGFLNISITPIECSIVCQSSWVERVFNPAIKNLPKEAAKAISISKDTYMVLSVISAGLDPAGRVIELTSPLALAGISIFFISTYYSDFILVPAKERQNVTKALIAKGFELSDNQTNFTAPTSSGHKRTSSSVSPPGTPPPANISELQNRAFELLKKRNVAPQVDNKLELIQCSGQETSQLSGEFSHSAHVSRGNGHSKHSWLAGIDTGLYLCIVSALASQPRFISITLAHEDPPSLLIDKELLSIFGESVVGDTDGVQIPIFLDLVNVPFEATGIVCGVAGRLVQEMQMAASSELSYLSTARAGAVILPEEHSHRALETLKPLLSGEK